MTAVQAAFSEIQIIKSRSVMVLKCEVPLEVADKVLAALGGIPIPGEERWLALARIMPPEARPEPAEPHKDLARSMDGRARYAEQTPGEQARTRAALLAKDPRFQGWLTAAGRTIQADERTAAEYIREWCGCEESRREIATDPEKLRAFERLEGSFQLYRQGYENA